MPSVKILSGEPPAIRVEGTEVRKPKPEDLAAFGIPTQNDLLGLIGNHLGARPKAVYMEDPLPWGDQSYGKYGLESVRVLVRYMDARIDRLERNPVIVNRKEFENTRRDKKPGTFGGDISRTVTNVMERNWNAGGSVGFEQSIYYEVGGDAVGGKVGGSTTLSATASYGEGGRTEKQEALTSGTNVEVELEYGEKVTASLTCMKGILVAHATVASSLQGTFFVDMGRRYKGHFFHFVPVARVKAMVLKRTETIQAEQYSEEHVVLT